MNLTAINAANELREKVRDSFPGHSLYVFEHLSHGSCHIHLEQVGARADLKVCLSQVPEFNEGVIDGALKVLTEKLSCPVFPVNFDPVEKIKLLLGTDANPVTYESGKPIEIDTKKFKEFRANWDDRFTDEENVSARNEILFALANRKWLRENKKTLYNTEQNRKFHELANQVRLSDCKDLDAVLFEIFKRVTCND